MDYEKEIKELHGVIDALVGIQTGLFAAVTLMLRAHPNKEELYAAYPDVRAFISDQSAFLPMSDESMAFAKTVLDQMFNNSKGD